MNTAASIRLALAILMPASLCAADRIRIETKVLESEVTKIPHDLAEFAKLKGGEILPPQSMTIEFSHEGEMQIIRTGLLPSANNQKDEVSSTAVIMTVTPERRGEDIAFKGCLKMDEIVGDTNNEHQTQFETVTRTIKFSGVQKKGEEGWFDLINPPNRLTLKKVTIWIRFEQPNAEPVSGANRRSTTVPKLDPKPAGGTP